MWRPLLPGLGHSSVSGTQGEVSSTQTLWIEGVERVVSQRKQKCFYQKERRRPNRKKKKSQPMSALIVLFLPTPATQDKGNLIASQTVSPVCCHSRPFPPSTITCRAPVETGLGFAGSKMIKRDPWAGFTVKQGNKHVHS